MKQITALLISFLFIAAINAQCFEPKIPENRFSVGLGLGYGTKANGSIANMQLEYNISKVRIAYSQTVFFAGDKPAFFELKGGYQLGNSISFTPHAGVGYEVMDIDQGNYNACITYGAEFNMEINPFIYCNPRVFADFNRFGKYNLFLIGFKASL